MSWTWGLKVSFGRKVLSQESHSVIAKLTFWFGLDCKGFEAICALVENWMNSKFLGPDSFITVLMSLKLFETSRKHASEPGKTLI